MKGIYIIAIAFWGFSAVIIANEDFNPYQYKECTLFEDFYDDIPKVCPCPEKCPENTTTNLPHESICTKFYKCDMCKGVEQDCPLMIKDDPVTRLHYNRHKQVCDWPWQAGCNSCPQKDETGEYPPPDFIGDEKDCKKYYKCKDGEIIEECNCEKDDECFSRTCQKCVKYREGGYCDDYTNTTIPTPTTSSTTPPCEDGAKTEHQCDCATYYICVDGKDVLYHCPDGLHYSPSEYTCLPPNEAGNKCNKTDLLFEANSQEWMV